MQLDTVITCPEPTAAAFSGQLLQRIEANKLPLNQLESIKTAFAEYNIPYSTWEAAARERFEKQVQLGETVIYVLDGQKPQNPGPDPRVVRFSYVVALRVIHPDGQRELFEYKQDKIKMEAGKVIPGMSEKVMRQDGWDFVTAAVRGLNEELKVTTVDRGRIVRDVTCRNTLLYKPDARGFYVGLFVKNYVLQLTKDDPIKDLYVGDDPKSRFVWHRQ